MAQLDHKQTPAKMVTIKDYCLALPYWSRVRLFNALKESIINEADNPDHRIATIKETGRGERLFQVMEDILGEPVNDNSKRPRYVWARAMIGYQLTQEGFSTTEAGEQIGRDHASVSYHNAKMRFVLDHPYAYPDIIDIWKQFQNRIKK